MTLEDFFTLTEMKNGLATLARVEELISIIQQQKDCVMSSVSDTTRQWASVSSTLAVTEDKDCLTHFVKLNGLSYLNQWLQEALKFSNDTSEIAVEELFNSLLGSLGKLPIHREDAVASGIQFTVEQLIGFQSLDIKEKARALSDRWKHSTENGVIMNKDGKCEDASLKPPGDVGIADAVNLTNQVFDNSTCRAGLEESNGGEESAGTGCQSSHHSNVAGCTEASKLDNNDDVLTSTENEVLLATSLSSATANASLEDMDAVPSAPASNFCQENLSQRGDSSLCPAIEMASSATCCSNALGDVADGHCDASELKDDTAEETKMEVDAKVGNPSESGQTESCKVTSSSGLSVSSHAHKPGRSVSCNFDAQKIKPFALETRETFPRSASIDCVVPKYLKNMDLKPDMQDLLSNGSKLRINDDSETSLRQEVASVSEAKEVDSESKLNFSRVDAVALHDSSKLAKKRSAVEMDEGSELGLEYGEIDALEVARQVAIEVEREVVDYREPFCSSSPDDNSREDMVPQCLDDHQDQSVKEEQDGRGSQPGRDLDDASLPKDNNLRIEETDQSPDKCENMEMSKPLTHESSDESDKNRCIFDLNEDVYVEESDCLINSMLNSSVTVSAPIAVAASKGAPNFPVSPHRFEGENGWKGSAATSAFRPASPRRTSDVEKTSSGQKRKANLIEIDLNVAESGEEAVDPLSVKRIPAFSGIPSREDSAEVSSRRADRLRLDLNRLGDEDAVSPFPPSCWSLSHQNGDRTMSPASSSSSRQPTTRDFDLNDNPTFFDSMGSHNLSRFSSKASGMHTSSRPDNPVITIMGSKITDYMDEAPLSFMGNGSSADAAVMASRPMVPYGHIPLPAYGYNGPVMGPPMPFPPPFYGPVNYPYMVDSRGATVVPQILNASGLNMAPSALPPFLMSVSNTSTNLNGAGTSQSGLDLNSGFMSLETGSRGTGNFRNFFAQAHNGLMEDPMRAASQPATAGVSTNRKETKTNSGWEPYTFGYKQVTSWQ